MNNIYDQQMEIMTILGGFLVCVACIIVIIIYSRVWVICIVSFQQSVYKLDDWLRMSPRNTSASELWWRCWNSLLGWTNAFIICRRRGRGERRSDFSHTKHRRLFMAHPPTKGHCLKQWLPLYQIDGDYVEPRPILANAESLKSMGRGRNSLVAAFSIRARKCSFAGGVPCPSLCLADTEQGVCL